MAKTVTSADKLAAAFKKINEIYSPGTIGELGTMKGLDIERFPTGSITLDGVVGGGYPKGRIIEIYGPESSGKTTLAIHAVAEVQKLGGKAAYIDTEQAFDREYAANLGVNIKELIFSQPDTGEQVFEVMEILLDTGEVDLIVVDSIATMTPKRELEGEMGDAVVGLQAKMMAQGLRKNVARIKKSNCTVIFINQIRDNVGVMYGSKDITTGGKSMKFYASIRLEVKKESIKQGDEIIANKTRVKVVKNKVAPPHKIAYFNISFGTGIDKTLEILEAAVEMDIINKAGSWFSYQDTKLGQGAEKVKGVLNDNPDLLDELEEKVMARFKEIKKK